MVQNWDLRYAANMHNYEGYSIGKLLGLINDPEIISLAGGLPSPDMFLRAELQMATRQRFDRDIAAYKPKYVTILLGMNDGSYTDFNQEIFVRRWNGANAWDELAGSASGGGISDNASPGSCRTPIAGLAGSWRPSSARGFQRSAP